MFLLLVFLFHIGTICFSNVLSIFRVLEDPVPGSMGPHDRPDLRRLDLLQSSDMMTLRLVCCQ